MRILVYRGVVACLALMALVSLVAGLRNGIVNHIDFQWMPAKIMASGENPYLYSLDHLPWRTWTQIDANQIPSCLLLLLPWTFLDYPLANTAWAFCNLFFTGIFLLYLHKTFFARQAPLKVNVDFTLVALLFLSGMPLRVLIGNGQHLMFSFAFFMPSLYYSLKGRHVLSGVLMSLCFFKYTTLAPMLLIFLTLRAWKEIAIGAGLHVLATLGVALYLHESPVTLIVQSLQVGSMLTGQGLSDVASLFKTLGCPLGANTVMASYAVFLCAALVIATIGNATPLYRLASLAILSNVMFYHREYDYVSIVFVLVLMLKMIRNPNEMNLLSIAICILVALDVLYMFYVFRIYQIPLFMPILEHVLLCCLLFGLFSRNVEKPTNIDEVCHN